MAGTSGLIPAAGSGVSPAAVPLPWEFAAVRVVAAPAGG